MIFQEFAQLENPMQRRVKGPGLGLPLSRKLAGLLGGSVEVSSVPGAGSTFTLSLPVGMAEPEAEPRAAPVRERSKAILIIDDEETARYLARQLFRGSAHRLIEAASAAEGAERARFERPALILLDLVMPGRSGFDVLDELKADTASEAFRSWFTLPRS